MRRAKSYCFLFVVLAFVLFNACSNTRFLAQDQLLYTGRKKVTFIDSCTMKEAKPAKEVIAMVTSFAPNNSLFGNARVLPPIGLWVNNYMKPKKEGKKGNWFYRNLKKEPILVSQVNPEQRCRELESALFNIGFFHVQATFSLDTNAGNPRKAGISYAVIADHPFRINKIFTPSPKDSIDYFINGYLEKMDIAAGDVFNLERIKGEKQKIAAQLVEKGYYFLSAENIEFIADTSSAPFQINLRIGKVEDTPDYIFKKYTLHTITVNLTGLEGETTDTSGAQGAVFLNGIYFKGLRNYIKPEVVARCIQFKSGDIYTTTAHQGTIRKLNNYAVFKYVKLQFLLVDSNSQKLDLLIDLSPKDNVSLNLEGYLQSKSTGFAGPGIEVSVANGNVKREANRLQLKFSGGFEWQWGPNSTQNLGTNSYNAGVNASYAFPRLLTPFRLNNTDELITTKTITALGYEFVNNVQYYRMNAVNFSFTYQWKKRQKITYLFSPLKINMVNLIKTTAAFDTIVDSNPYVKKSFEEQSIFGMESAFIYDNTQRKGKGIYLQAIIGAAGNALGLLKAMGSGEQPYTLLGNVYSQFIKPSFDFRFYTRNTKQGFVFRYFAGAGFSYINSNVMPYVEQFYSGGSNSIRGFPARALGPGSYKPEESNGIIDQTGDIKQELNVEYRFSFTEMVLGALFVDVGNVWLLNEDKNRPGAEFHLNNFYDQLAVGTGAGLRFDFGFFVMRTDFGFPLRRTYKQNNSNWYADFKEVISDFRFNLAIGYPF